MQNGGGMVVIGGPHDDAPGYRLRSGWYWDDRNDGGDGRLNGRMSVDVSNGFDEEAEIIKNT